MITKEDFTELEAQIDQYAKSKQLKSSEAKLKLDDYFASVSYTHLTLPTKA